MAGTLIGIGIVMLVLFLLACFFSELAEEPFLFVGYREWRSTVRHCGDRRISFQLFETTYRLDKQKWYLYPGYVSLNCTSLAFSTYKDYKKYRKLKQGMDDVREKAERAKEMGEVMRQLYEVYTAANQEKEKHGPGKDVPTGARWINREALEEKRKQEVPD